MQAQNRPPSGASGTDSHLGAPSSAGAHHPAGLGLSGPPCPATGAPIQPCHASAVAPAGCLLLHLHEPAGSLLCKAQRTCDHQCCSAVRMLQTRGWRADTTLPGLLHMSCASVSSLEPRDLPELMVTHPASECRGAQAGEIQCGAGSAGTPVQQTRLWGSCSCGCCWHPISPHP